MNEIKVFENPSFGVIRTVMQNNEPWFVAADVCRVLELDDTSKAVSRIDDDEKGTSLIPTPGGQQSMNIVNEPGLYSLVLGSHKPEAKSFKRWITHDVLPSIRKTGSYSADKNDVPRLRAEAMALNAKTRQAALWVKLGALLPDNAEHKTLCASYASEVLTGKKVIALPKVERTFSAEEIGKLYSISANMVGRIANANGLKTEEYGHLVLDKSRYSSKEVESFRYNEKGLRAIGQYLPKQGESA